MDYSDLPVIPVYGFAPNAGGLLGLIITFVLPIVAAFFMKQSWSAGTKGLILLALAAVKSIVEAWLMAYNTGVDFDFVPLVYTVVVNFIIAVAVHFGLWRGTNVQVSAIRSGVTDGRDSA